MEISYGAKVLDKNDKAVGVIDYLIQNTYTGDLKKFRVKTDSQWEGSFFSPEDVLEATADKVKLKIALDEGEH